MSEVIIAQQSIPNQPQATVNDGRLFRWFSKYAPHSAIKPDNPVRSYELRDAPTMRQLYKQSIRWGVYPAITVLLIYAVFAIAIIIEGKPQPYFLPHLFHAVEKIHTVLFFIATIGIYLVMDFIGITRSINSISHEFDNANWDIILLTDMESKRFLWGKHASSQIRPWKYMCLTIGLRTALLIMVFIHQSMRVFMLHTPQEVFRGWLDYPLNIPALIVLFIIVLMLIMTYLLEPYWHLRLMVAAGLVGSAKNTHHTVRVLNGMGQITGMWALQLVIMLFVLFIMYLFSLPSQNALAMIKPAHYPFVDSVILFIVAGIGVWVFYGVYATMTDGMIAGAARLLVRKGASIELPTLRIRRLFIIGMLMPLIVSLYATAWLVFESHQPLPPQASWDPYFNSAGAYETYKGIIGWLWVVLLFIGFFFSALVAALATNFIDQHHISGILNVEPLESDMGRISSRNMFGFLSGFRLVALFLLTLFLSLGASSSYNLGAPITHLSKDPLDYLFGLPLVILFAFYCYREPLWRANAYYPFFKHFYAQKRRLLTRVLHTFIYLFLFVGVEFIIAYTAIFWFGIFAWDVLFDPNVHLLTSGFDLVRVMGLLIAVYGVYRVIIGVLGRYLNDDFARIGNDLLHMPVSLSDGRVV